VAQAVVLVVEDNEKSLELACDLLRLRDYEPLAASTGAEAVRIARENLPALVLMDVQLPDMEGGSALATLRADPSTAGIPVVAVTAYAMKGDRERLLAQGFDGYISKPIDVRSFVDDVAALIGCRK
jgi:two-component system cell cycle response regulator DivK